jgi:hypothetical protein
MAEMEKQGSALAGVTFEGNDFAALLKKEFKPKTDEAKGAVEQAVQTLAQQALANTALRSTDSVRTIEAMIAALDKRLTEQVNKIIHHEDFQKLEAAWRGLHYLVNNTETDEHLKIRVMNVSVSKDACCSRARPGISPRSRNCTRRSTASSAASPTAAPWAIPLRPHAARRRAVDRCQSSPPPRTRRSSPAPAPASCRWSRGRSPRIRAT